MHRFRRLLSAFTRGSYRAILSELSFCSGASSEVIDQEDEMEALDKLAGWLGENCERPFAGTVQ